MKVWIVSQDYDREGLDTRAVFATEEAAKAWVAAMNEKKPQRGFENPIYDIEEWEVTE